MALSTCPSFGAPSKLKLSTAVASVVYVRDSQLYLNMPTSPTDQIKAEHHTISTPASQSAMGPRSPPPSDQTPPSKKPKVEQDSQPQPQLLPDDQPPSISFPRSVSIRVEHTTSSQTENSKAKKEDDEEGSKPSTAKSDSAKPPPKTTYCNHCVSVPHTYPGEYDFEALKEPENPAKKYSFNLDAFQNQSVKCIERNESVLVAAHTSAGKTAVAEYAIALALRNKQRVIYTSPIKALSNQKYRELESEFKDVGLMTGDNTIDKNASCLVMTTEILRSMLYRGSEVVREVAWVIFDEVHYMRDKDRGVVWEEAIILVPQNVRFVFLSATIPNAREFSEWVAYLKQSPCHTIYTETRPVPLKHYIYSVGGGEGFHCIIDGNGKFLANNFDRAMAEMKSSALNKGGNSNQALSKKKRQAQSNASKADCYKVVDMIRTRGFHPVIVFSFSRRDCETFAMQLSKLDFNTPDERELVQQIFVNAISSLNEEDRELPQITAILPLLLRGVGIHHSGLLPIIKEVVELLFHEGLIKCLFATETFAMGVNMPARTVLFTQVRKFDGEKIRVLNGGEYVQMSGRAGRRGVDTEGVAILMCDEQLEPSNAKSLMSGSSEPLNSTFRLGYNMLLNLLRAEEADPEAVIGRSFAQFQGDRAVPKLEEALRKAESERDDVRLGGPEFGVVDHEVRNYFKLKSVAENIKLEVRDFIHKPSYVCPFLQPGRLLRVCIRTAQGDRDYGWGAVVDFRKRGRAFGSGDDRYNIEVLLRCQAGSNRNTVIPLPFKPSTHQSKQVDPRRRRQSGEDGEEWMIVPCAMRDMQGLSALRLVKPNDLRTVEARSAFGRSIQEVLRRFPDGPPMLDPISDMRISDEKLVVLLRKAEAVDEAMTASAVNKCSDITALAQQWNVRKAAEQKVKDAKRDLKEAQGLILQEELKKMKRVLKRLGFTNQEGIVEVKGRVACEVNTADELVITELLLGGNMNDMTPEILVALCSCFVIDEGKKDEDLRLDKELEIVYEKLKAVATRVATVKKEAGLLNDIDDFVDKFKPHAMKVVYYWMLGRSFSEVCSFTDLFEGSVIRCFRRLEELLRQLITAVKGIGNTELAEKIEQGSEKLKRGIAFHSSLYI